MDELVLNVPLAFLNFFCLLLPTLRASKCIELLISSTSLLSASTLYAIL